MENISEKIMSKLTALAENEIVEFRIKAAIFERKISDKIFASIKEIEMRLDEEIEYYNQNPKNYEDYKKGLIDGYKKEFEKIANEFELQFVNICEELQETQANQKIAIANCKKMKNSKDEFLMSKDYLKYKELKTRYKEDMDNSLTKVDFEKNMNLLKNLKNPVDEFDNKIKANIIKIKDYEEIIEKCSSKMTECTQKANEELNGIVARKTSQLQIYNKTNYFVKIFDKISNFFTGKKKIQIYLIDKAPLEMQEIEESGNEMQEKIKEETISFIDQLMNYRKELNFKYKNASEA